MGSNIEIKASVDDLAELESRVRELADRGPQTIEQRDVFFATSKGRLKLRCFAGGSGELIYYERPDVVGARRSFYEIAPVERTAELERTLAAAFGVRAVVRKTRRLYWAGRTRLHLDQVAGLGDYIELEVVLAEGEATENGQRVAFELMRRLAVDPNRLVAEAYVDLLPHASGTD